MCTCDCVCMCEPSPSSNHMHHLMSDTQLHSTCLSTLLSRKAMNLTIVAPCDSLIWQLLPVMVLMYTEQAYVTAIFTDKCTYTRTGTYRNTHMHTHTHTHTHNKHTTVVQVNHVKADDQAPWKVHLQQYSLHNLCISAAVALIMNAGSLGVCSVVMPAACTGWGIMCLLW